MKIAKFKEYLELSKPPVELNNPLTGLWYDAKGDWPRAHQAVGDDSSVDSAWVHAYLHRKEGDLANASYWYHQAKQEVYDGSLSEEWESLVQAIN